MSLWTRIFPSRRPKIVDRRHDAGWSVGDLAVCIADRFFPGTPVDPRREELLRVSHVTDGVAVGSNVLIHALGFEGRPENVSWESNCFRKVKPDAEAGDREEWVGLVERFSRRRERA